MSTYVKYNGSWREPMSIYVNDGGTGKDVGGASSATVLNPGLGVETYPTVKYETPRLTTEDLRLNIDDTDTHEQTDGEILLDSDGSTVGSSLGDTSNLTSIDVPSGNLSTSTTYRYRARHKGSTFGGSNGDEIIDTTESSFTVPENEPAGTYLLGGYKAGNITYNSTDYTIIVSPKSSGEGSSLVWSSHTSTQYGCTDEYDGKSNTDCMLNNDTTLNSGTATKFIDGIRTNGINGYNDGYIPAISELRLMYNSMHNANLTGTDWDNDTESFDGTDYWSSTEAISSHSSSFNFSNGDTDESDYKTKAHYVRAVRRVAV